MKASLLFLFILFFSSALIAQPADSLSINLPKFYVGIGLSSNYYLLNFENKSVEPRQSSTFAANPYINFGYKLNRRTSLQVGVAYSNNKDHSYATYYGMADSTIEYHHYSKNKGIVIPITLRFVFLNAYKKLPIYGSVSIIPAYARTKLRNTEVYNNNKLITTFTGEASGINAFFTAGLGFNYNFKKHFSGYAEVLLINRNMSGDNVNPYRFVRFNVYRHLGLGVNYNL